MLVITSRVIATCFALVSFAAASVVGFIAGNETTTIIWRSTIVMIICWFIGRAIGYVAQQTVDDHISKYKNAHPIPSDDIDDDSHLEDQETQATASAALAGQQGQSGQAVSSG